VDPKNIKVVDLIPCSCGTPYIGEIGRFIYQRIQEHVADLRHCRTRSSALVEHAEETKHHTCLEDSKVLARIDHFHHCK